MKRERSILFSFGNSVRRWLGILLVIVTSLTVLGAPPEWWEVRGVLNGGSADNFAAVNQGQLKHMAVKAYADLEEQLANIGGTGSMVAPNGTGYRLKQMIDRFEAARVNPTPQTDNYAVVNLGQLKNVAKPFYDRLIEIGFTTHYPWTTGTADDDNLAAANLGQLKNVFSFDLSVFRLSLNTVDVDADGMSDEWEVANGFDPGNSADGTGDADSDGLTNAEEEDAATDPHGNDSDGDGILDGEDALPLDGSPHPLTLTFVVPDIEASVDDPDLTTVRLEWTIPSTLSGASSIILQRAAGLNAPWGDCGSFAASSDGSRIETSLYSCMTYRYRLVLLDGNGRKTPCSPATYEVPLLRAMKTQLATTYTWFPGFTDPQSTAPVPVKYCKQSNGNTTEIVSPFEHKFEGSGNLYGSIEQSVVAVTPHLGHPGGSFAASYRHDLGDFANSGIASQSYQVNFISNTTVFRSMSGTESYLWLYGDVWRDQQWDGGTLTTTYIDLDGITLDYYPYLSTVEDNVGPPFLAGDGWPWFADPDYFGDWTYSVPFSTAELIQLALANLPPLDVGAIVPTQYTDSGSWSYTEGKQVSSAAVGAGLANFEIGDDEQGVFVERGSYQITVNPPAPNPDRPPALILTRSFYPKDNPATPEDESLEIETTTLRLAVAAGQSEFPVTGVDLLAGYGGTPGAAPQGSVGIDVTTLPQMALEMVSRDRFLAGSFVIPTGWDSLEMEFFTGEYLGRYGSLLGGGSTKIYDSVTDIMNDADLGAGSQPDSQKVWFVKDSANARKINFYTCFNSIGEVHVRLWRDGMEIGESKHQLTAAQDFADWINYVDKWVKGEGFEFPGEVGPQGLSVASGPGLSLADMTLPSSVAPANGELSNLSRACLIPIFNVLAQAEGVGAVALGVFGGIKSGLNDDWMMVQTIGFGLVTAGNWQKSLVETQIGYWRTDPLKRAGELKRMTDRICEDLIFKSLQQIAPGLSSWDGFKTSSWQTWERIKGGGKKAWTATGNCITAFGDGISDWVDDFNNRMMIGGEKAAFENTPWVKDQLLRDLTGVGRQMAYTAGYVFGYACEQIAIGGATVIAKVAVKGGVTMAGNLAARTAFATATRLHLLKQTLKKSAASVAVAVEMHLAVERGLVRAASTRVSPTILNCIAEVVENPLARSGFNRGLFNLKICLDEILTAPNLKKLVQLPGYEGRFWEKLGIQFQTLGLEASENASKGWVKFYNRLLKFGGNTFLDDRADDALKMFKAGTSAGNMSMKKSMEEFAQAVESSGPAAKCWFRDVENVYSTGYRYVSEIDGLIKNGGKFTANTGMGWWCTFDDFADSISAMQKLQLPPRSLAKYKVEFDTVAVKNNVRIPRGRREAYSFFEPLAKDYPLFGAGGGTQFLVDGAEIPAKKIWDISGPVPIVVYP